MVQRIIAGILIVVMAITAGVVCAKVLTKYTEGVFHKDEKKPVKKTAIYNPITGEKVKRLNARPLIVSTDNVGDAIPQSNISHADIVYEFPVEGKQTRLECIYYSDFPEFFGPIRSTRPYFVDLTREYKGIFLAHGWSPDAKEYLMSGVVPYINAMNSELEFYRVSDKEAPHNSYIKWSEVKGKIDKEGWWDVQQKIEPFGFLKGKEAAEGEKEVNHVEFSYAGSDCEFTYDKTENLYTRTYDDGKEYVDKETGQPIKVSNVLVQKVSSQVLDDKGRLEIDMCSGGDAMLFTGGKVIEGSWMREGLDERTKFFYKGVNENTEEFKLTPGKSWVEVADQNCKIKYKPAEKEKKAEKKENLEKEKIKE